MNKEDLYQLSFHLIAHSGNARSLAMEAIQNAKAGEFKSSEDKLIEADEEFAKAHKYQTELIHKEAGGADFHIPIILIHAQDHLMTAQAVKDLAKEIIELYSGSKKPEEHK
ncbi:PTS cellobiose transporter subunit IIA [Bacillus lacus]|uniref:PTS cellobiose transporter subunit IIA n=1 Tax=Metabacillus lacus TaxID=1983721 RepID=A0A7X2IXF8_9BACI|nr:PTS lactose/cellobiose transporter subunit IIA [Metabacillus lacus]MRX71596.1 PTS cellobiose transporter subunit IIA [Metabacillus lacus]